MISVLCVCPGSNYYKIPGLDLWDKERDAWKFVGSNMVITHAPCAQWSKLRAFAHENAQEKQLAMRCLELVSKNGGVFEHPEGSQAFKAFGVRPNYCIDQSWFGFEARKRTWLYTVGVKLDMPIFCELRTLRRVQDLSSYRRSLMPLKFCQYLVSCVASVQS